MKKQQVSMGSNYAAPRIDVELFAAERGFINSIDGTEGLEGNDTLGWDD